MEIIRFLRLKNIHFLHILPKWRAKNRLYTGRLTAMPHGVEVPTLNIVDRAFHRKKTSFKFQNQFKMRFLDV